MSEPARPWLVRAAADRSMASAFEQVKAVHASGSPACAYRWHDGGWVLHEHLEPPPAPPQQQDEPGPFWPAGLPAAGIRFRTGRPSPRAADPGSRIPGP